MVPSIEGKSRGRSSSSSVYLFKSAFAAVIGGAAAAPLYPSTASAVFNPLRTVVARRSTRRDPLIADDVPGWDWGRAPSELWVADPLQTPVSSHRVPWATPPTLGSLASLCRGRRALPRP